MILDRHTLNRTARGIRQQGNQATAAAQATLTDAGARQDWLTLAGACFGVAQSLEDIADLMERLQLTEIRNAA